MLITLVYNLRPFRITALRLTCNQLIRVRLLEGANKPLVDRTTMLRPAKPMTRKRSGLTPLLASNKLRLMIP